MEPISSWTNEGLPRASRSGAMRSSTKTSIDIRRGVRFLLPNPHSRRTIVTRCSPTAQSTEEWTVKDIASAQDTCHVQSQGFGAVYAGDLEAVMRIYPGPGRARTEGVESVYEKGKFGENVFLAACSLGTPQHITIAKYLVRRGGGGAWLFQGQEAVESPRPPAGTGLRQAPRLPALPAPGARRGR